MIKTKVKNKIESGKGASILFALLVLLVCMVVGSVVLTAGTAAAGRLSNTAEADQRYYAVSSAAEVLRDAFDGQRIDIRKEKVTTVEITYELDADENLVEASRSTPEVRYSVYAEQNGGPVNSASSLPVEFAIDAVFGKETVLNGNTLSSTDFELDTPPAASEIKKVYQLSSSKYGEALNADVVCSLTKNKAGELIVTISSPKTDAAVSNSYAMQLTFHADIRLDKGARIDESVPDAVSDTEYVSVYTEEERKSYIVQWNFVKAETIGKTGL